MTNDKTISMCKRDYERKINDANERGWYRGVCCGVAISCLVLILMHIALG